MITLKNARRAGVPLVVVETSDAHQSIRTIINDLNGNAKETSLKTQIAASFTEVKKQIDRLVVDAPSRKFNLDED